MRLVVINHVTLDGVFQGPARPDEDPSGGFTQSGWAAGRGEDPALAALMSERMGTGFSWLFGRRSYDDMLTHWNAVGGPFRDGLNGTPKYVASSDPATPLPWPGSTLLSGDVPAEVRRLRAEPGGHLVTLGSGTLVRSLLAEGLVDELVLFVHPVVLGSGRRLFGADDGRGHLDLRLVSSTTAGSGVVALVYAAT